ncbi:terminase small subunit, partial [Nitrospira sp. BLG_1]|uniref:terminase small subunit n=1 Tax=Nitrospira sp. BLG_1 TaxID=3395883 RepID=UPI0039BCFA91
MSDSPSPTPRKLTPKQELFIIEYAKDFNATQAAIRAGYTGKCINRTASQLLARTRYLVEERQQQQQEQERHRQLALRAAGGVPEPDKPPVSAIATLEQSLRLVTALAFGDPRKLFDAAGNPKNPDQLTRRQALMLTGFDVEE